MDSFTSIQWFDEYFSTSEKSWEHEVIGGLTGIVNFMILFFLLLFFKGMNHCGQVGLVFIHFLSNCLILDKRQGFSLET